MITLAREARGLVQSELAKKLSIGQGTLSKIEGGVLAPGESILAALSAELDFPVDFFLEDGHVHGLGTDAHHQLYRRRKSLSMKSLKQVEAMVNIARMHLATFLRSVSVEPDRTIPRLDLEEYEGNVEHVAASIRAAWTVPGGPIDNLIALLESAGAIVVPFDFGTDQIDATSVWLKDLPPIIFYNRGLLADRCRFTLAHELGHLVMHSLVPSPDMENEADRFAAEFLMPAKEIGPQLARMSLRRAAQLKPYWKVSMASLIYRAQQLGKLTKQEAQRLYISMGAHGYRTREPAELDIPLEQPRTHADLLTFHTKSLGYSREELQRLLRIGERDFDRLYRPVAELKREAVPVRTLGEASVYAFPTARRPPSSASED